MLVRDVPLDILERNEFGIARAKSEDTIQGRQKLYQLRQQYQVLHPIDKKVVDGNTKYLRENLQDLLLKTVSFNDDVFQDKIGKITAHNKFNHSLRYYRDNINNPFTLSRKIFNLVLDPNGEYKRVKSQQKLIKKKVVEHQMKEQYIRVNQILDKFGGNSANKYLTTTLKLTGNVKRRMTLSKSMQNLTKHNVIDFTQMYNQIQQHYQFPHPETFAKECAPDSDLFVKQSLNQQNATTFQKNNYALDLIKPNQNLTQYKNKEETEKKKKKKKEPNLNYLFEKPKNIFIIDSKRGGVSSRFNQTSNTFITTLPKQNETNIINDQDGISPIQKREKLSFKKQAESPIKSQNMLNGSLSMVNMSMTQVFEEQSTMKQNQDIEESKQIEIQDNESSFEMPVSSKRTSITSMDTEKMIRLNMEADKETLDSGLLARKKKRQRYFIKHRRNQTVEKSMHKFTIKPQPCYPKESVDAYMHKFKLMEQRHHISQSLQNSNKKASQKLDHDKEQLAVFLSFSKKELEDMEKETQLIAERRAMLQQQINFRLRKAEKNVLSEFSNDIDPSNEQLREINHELKKMNSISNERAMYAVKFNRKIQTFKPLSNCKSKEEISLRQYREQFLSNIEQDGQIPSGDDENEQIPNNFDEFTVRGQRDFPNFYKIKQNLNLLYDVPSLKDTKVKFEEKLASLRQSYQPV